MSSFIELIQKKTNKGIDLLRHEENIVKVDALTLINLYEDKANILMSQVNDIVIKTPDDQNCAVDIDGKIGRLMKALDNERKDVTAEARQFVQTINNNAKKISDPLNRARLGIKAKMRQYAAFVEAERRKQQKAIEEANRKLQEKLNKEAAKSGIEPPKVAPIEAPPPTKVVGRGSSGSSAHTRKVWKGEITDAGQVPREYCEPSQRLINEAVKAGLRTIPGVRIWEDVSIVTRI